MSRLRRPRLLLGLAGLALIGAVLAQAGSRSENATPLVKLGDAHDTQKGPAPARLTVALPLPEAQVKPISATPDLNKPRDHWETTEVESGDSLSSIFSRLEIHSQLAPILKLGNATRSMRQLYPGQKFRARKDLNGLAELVFEPDADHIVRVWRTATGYQAENQARENQVRLVQAQGVIRDSLFSDGQRAGLSDGLIMNLAAIFGWDIDFALDLRPGDHFTVIYEQIFRNGVHLRDGDIIAAEFVNQGRSYKALRYKDPKGDVDYYAPDGKRLRKEFLRTPVNFTRISSGFSLHRKHPILNVIRAHKGVDYAAPTGTPIRAAGDGKVVFKGRKGGYGKVIILRHGAIYSTVYGHMSRYARGLSVGKRVRQGQIIGYVGMTGLATGPHLHYEFRVHGVHRNPLTVKLPAAAPLPARYHADFQAHTEEALARLRLLSRIQVASLEIRD
ncbi:MAG: peptidoglycan DD-metalloendopeptidase family protein [Gammaproteobacteria bacterium]